MHASSVSLLRRVATPKKVLTGTALAGITAGLALSAAPAQAAPRTAAPTASVRSAAPAAASSSSSSAQAIAKKLIPDSAQYQAFSKIVAKESGWNIHAQNSSSGAYGLVQALPANKMASAGSDWKDNAETQIKWGLDYMNERYGSPVGAWQHEQANGWY
ncbi:transglycosylase SLT domain-containing protein [Streptomyces tsukubensis]|uniref:aggregation-promoting factor C-terminal-like domain-containing protein n=1 Tax=Streptomyces tsukubensis TaxID=83656 RepID=UPI001265EBF7|nr:transglycosylase SLT domain-containing protein [Streptomyces tsukubensis]